jgi:hypothetical protein
MINSSTKSEVIHDVGSISRLEIVDWTDEQAKESNMSSDYPHVSGSADIKPTALNFGTPISNRPLSISAPDTDRER